MFIRDTWRTFDSFSSVKTLLDKIKEIFTHSPARRRRYIDHLHFSGVTNIKKIPFPAKTRWNSWFEMVLYTRDYLVYWPEFFQSEFEHDETDALRIICSFLSDAREFGLITIYINFISKFSKEFISTLNFFQQEKPIIPYVEGRLQQLTNFIESNVRAAHFGSPMDEIISQNGFQPSEFYPIFQSAFAKAYLKFAAHIPSHPGRPFFNACQIFNPKFIHTGGVSQKNLRRYEIIPELSNPSDDLLNEWAIYCNLQDDIEVGEIDLNEYWLKFSIQLPLLSQITLDYI